jgi:hypothetical protein
MANTPLTQAPAGVIEGITEGAKNSMVAVSTVLMIFRMCLRIAAAQTAT